MNVTYKIFFFTNQSSIILLLILHLVSINLYLTEEWYLLDIQKSKVHQFDNSPKNCHEASFSDREIVKKLTSGYEDWLKNSPSVFNVWLIKIIRRFSSLLSRFWLFAWKVALKRQTRIDGQSKTKSGYARINTVNTISNTTLCYQTRVKLS